VKILQGIRCCGAFICQILYKKNLVHLSVLGFRTPFPALMGGIWHGGVDLECTSPRQISPYQCSAAGNYLFNVHVFLQLFAPKILVVYFLSLSALFFYMSKFPECWFPGWLDVFGN